MNEPVDNRLIREPISRESQSVVAADPADINQGSKFIFLKNDATERMRRNKQKTRYVFLDEEVKLISAEEQKKPRLNDSIHSE